MPPIPIPIPIVLFPTNWAKLKNPWRGRLNPKAAISRPSASHPLPSMRPATPHSARQAAPNPLDLPAGRDMAAPNPAAGAAGAPPPREGPALTMVTRRIDAYKERLALLSELEASVADGRHITRQELRDSKYIMEGVKRSLEDLHRDLSNTLKELLSPAPPEVEMSHKQKDEEKKNEANVVNNGETADSQDSFTLDETIQRLTATELGAEDKRSEDSSSSGSALLKKSFSALVTGKNDAHILAKYRNFLGGFKVSGDAANYYVCQAIGIACCGSSIMHILYGHLDTYDTEWARDIVNNKDRLAGQLATIAVEFVSYVAGYYKIRADILEMKVEFIQMPESRAMLKAVLLAPHITEKIQVHLQKRPVAKPSPFGCELLSGVLFDFRKNHRMGRSWDGQLTLDNFEVINGHQVIITKKPIQYEIGDETIPVETRNAFWRDFGVMPNLILSKFVVLGCLNPPHLSAFRRCLEKPKLDNITTWSDLDGHYELLVNHALIKPPIAVLNLFSGIHSSCRSYDHGDDTVLYKSLLGNKSSKGPTRRRSWMDMVRNSNNAMLIGVLDYPTRADPEPGRPLPDAYIDTLESFSSYLRHSGFHTTDNTRKRRQFQPVLEGKDGPVEEKKPEPRLQMIKLQDEIITTAAMFLAEIMQDVLALLINSRAIEGMLLSHWRVYKNCSSYDKKEEDADGRTAE